MAMGKRARQDSSLSVIRGRIDLETHEAVQSLHSFFQFSKFSMAHPAIGPLKNVLFRGTGILPVPERPFGIAGPLYHDTLSRRR